MKISSVYTRGKFEKGEVDTAGRKGGREGGSGHSVWRKTAELSYPGENLEI